MSKQVYIVNKAWSYLFPGAERDSSGDHKVFCRPDTSLADLDASRFQWVIEGELTGRLMIRNNQFGYLFGSDQRQGGDRTAWCREKPSADDLKSERFHWTLQADRGGYRLRNCQYGYLFGANSDVDSGDHFAELRTDSAADAKYGFMIYDKPLSDWMSALPDGKLMSELSIPGTHESCALYSSDKQDEWAKAVDTGVAAVDKIGGFFASVAGKATDAVTGAACICQALKISDQLRAGVRYLDIRLCNSKDALLVFHGAVYQHQNFDGVLKACTAFLDAHPSECIIMSVKKEGEDSAASLSYEDRFRAYVQQSFRYWWLGESLPTLGSVRGKIVLVRRFPGTAPLGINTKLDHGWQDSATFEIKSPALVLKIQDEYDYGLVQESKKWAAIESHMSRAAADSDKNNWYLNYTSAVGGAGVPMPSSIATGINASLRDYLRDKAPVKVGTLATDFVCPSLSESILRLNFR